MFELNGVQLTLEQLQSHAKEKGYDFDKYMTNMRSAGMTEVKQATKDEEITFGSTVKDLASNFGLSFLDFAKGVKNYNTATYFAVADIFAQTETKEQKQALYKSAEKAQELVGKIIPALGVVSVEKDTYDNVIEGLEENVLKHENETISQDLQEFYQTKDYDKLGRAAVRAVGGGLRSTVSLIAAATGYGGIVALGASVAGNKFEEEFEKNPMESTGKLMLNATGSGIIEASFELATRGLLKRAGLINSKAGSEAAKAFLNRGAVELIKDIGGGFVGEATSEAATELTNVMWDRVSLGREIDWAKEKYRIFDAGIVGSLVGGTVSSVGELSRGNENARDRAVNILLDEKSRKNINNIADEINSLQKDLSKADEGGKEIILNEINSLANDIVKIKNNVKQGLDNLNKDQLQEYAKNVEKINNAKSLSKKENATDSEKSIAKKNYQTAVDANNKLVEDALTQAVAKTKQTVETLIKEGDLQGKITEMTSDEISNIKEEGFDSKEASSQFGFIRQSTDGSFEIVLNKDKPMIGTAAHEFMHAVLFKTLGNNQKLQDNLGNALIDHVSKLGGETSILGRRLAAYGKYNKEGVFERDSNFGEETITIMSEEIINGNLKFNENFFTKIGDVIRRFSQEYLGKEITFDTGRDVYNFVKDYSKSIKDGKINKAILKVAKEGARGTLVPIKDKVSPEATTQMSKEASDSVQRIYDKQGEAGAMDIIDKFKPIVNKIVDKRRDAPNFDRQLLTDEIETGKRGIFDLIREYDPKSGVPLAAYINKFLPARAIEASKRVLGEEFTQDVTEKVDIAAEEVATEVKAKPRPKKIVLADRLGITDKVSKAIQKIIPSLDIDKLTFKTLKNKVPEIVGDLFGIAPKKLITNANITKGELQSSQMFISKNADLLINMLPEGATASGTATGIPNSLLKAFYTKTGRAKMAKTGSKAGLAVQQKNNINRKQFLEVFGIVDGKPNRTDRNTSARVLALANTLGKMITNQAVRQNLGETDAKAKENVSRIKDGKSSIMFSRDASSLAKPLDNFQLAYEHKLGILSESLYGRNLRIPNHKEGLLKGTRNLDAIFNKETGETYKQAAVRVLNTFLESYPQYRSIIRSTMTGGKKAGLFKFANSSDKDFIKYKKRTGDDINFDDNIVDYPGVEQIGKKQSYNKNSKYSSSFHEKINTKEFKKENAKKLQDLLEFFQAIEAHLQNFKSDVWLFEEMLLDTSKHMNTVTRILAPISFYPIDPETKKPIFNKTAVEEHTDPQNLIGKALLSGAFFNKLDDVWKVIGKSYMQGSILKVDDPGGDLKANMPKSYYDKVVPRLLSGDLKLPNGYSSIVRLAESGIDPNAYMLINENKTIAEFFGVNNIKYKDGSANIDLQNETIIKQLTGEVAPRYGEFISKVSFSKDTNKNNKLSNAALKARTTSYSKESKGITVLDFDDTLATTESLVKYTAPDGETGTLNAEQFASTYQDLQDQGYTFDFSDFNRVVKGKLAPLFNKALKLQKKFGPENMFVLTARPAAAQQAIFDFLKANGLNIPLKNITGLGNSTSEAKALWMADKVSEGYNDFYFADDALQNVQAVKNMLDQFDVKSKIQQAKVQFSKDMDGEFNKILQDVTGIESKKRYSQTKARKRGEGKGKFRYFVPPSHEDFAGLLYNFMGKGEKGNKHREFFEQALLKPLNRAYQELTAAKQAIATDYKNLIKQFPDLRKKLTKKTPDGDYYYSDAVRVYLWDKAGFEIPGTSKTDVKELSDLVKNDPELQAFADTVGKISRMDEGYIEPGEHWEAGDIRTDLADATGRVGRAKFFNEFQENADIIFNQENLNKIEAAYGADFKEALKDILYRTKNGTNRTVGPNKIVNGFLDYLNGSIGATMFFNARSAVLQTLSTVNFINFGDNNIFKASAAFANQPQFWKDFSMIFNSDVLKQRRAGVAFDINANEIASAVGKSKTAAGKVRAAVKYLLQIGFLPTQMADSFAISLGGASMYRNRVNTYKSQGLSQKEAEAKAFTDFQEVSEATQQSARPDMISQQQASVLGRLILAFQNTPSQYVRLIKKAGLDLINRRKSKPYTSQVKSDMSNISRIIYYSAVQNIIFGALQTALFAMLFSEDDEEDEKTQKFFKSKRDRVINGTIDTILRGSGVAGAIVATIKNGLIKYHENQDKKWNKQLDTISEELIQLSPPIGIKKRKLDGFEKSLEFNKKVIPEMDTFDLDNPIWGAYAQLIEGATNIPVARLHRKIENVRAALNSENEWWQRLAVGLGWSKWDVGIENKEVEAVKEKIKKQKKKNKKKKKEFGIKRQELLF